MRTALYRHFDANGALLYVGISLSWPERTKAHSKGAAWFERIARVSIEWFETREEALAAERAAIISERPECNVVHNRGISEAKALRDFRDKMRERGKERIDPLLRTIAGPHVIVGPALIYRDDVISVMVAHGRMTKPSEITEVVLGNFSGSCDEIWMRHFASVMVLRRPNDITMDEAQELRASLIKRLSQYHNPVIECDTDLSFAKANARHFPSAKASRILAEIEAEKAA